MVRRLIIRASARIITLGIISGAAVYAVTQLLTPTSITITVDPLLSGQATAAITQEARELIAARKSEWRQILHARYPLTQISCAIKKPYHLMLNVAVQAPWLLINEDKLITENGLIVERSFFDTAYLQKPTIFFSQLPAKIDTSLLDWLAQHPLSFFAEHTVMIIDTHHIKIIHNQLPITCMVDSNTYYEKKHTKLVEKIIAQLATNKKISAQKRRHLAADLRFKNQIIIYQLPSEQSVSLHSTKRSLS